MAKKITTTNKVNEFDVIDIIALSIYEKPTKKILSIMEFLESEFNECGLCLPITKVMAKFTQWNNGKIIASSLDVCKLSFIACFLTSEKMYKKLKSLGKLEEGYIPLFKRDAHNVPTIYSGKASEFKARYAETIKDLQAKKKAKSERDAIKAEETKDAVIQSETTEVQSETTEKKDVTSEILALINGNVKFDVKAVKDALIALESVNKSLNEIKAKNKKSA